MTRKHKVHPLMSAENAHLMPSMNPHKFANATKRKWHRARRAGQLGEQIDRKFYQNMSTRQTALNAATRMRKSL